MGDWLHRVSSTFANRAVPAEKYPDSMVHEANLGPTWVLSAPDGPHVGRMNLAIRVLCYHRLTNGGCIGKNIDIDHYDDVIMNAITSQISSLTIVYSIVNSDADQRKHQSSASLAFVWGIHRGPANSPHKWPVTRKMFPFDDVIMHRQRQRHRHSPSHD